MWLVLMLALVPSIAQADDSTTYGGGGAAAVVAVAAAEHERRKRKAKKIADELAAEFKWSDARRDYEAGQILKHHIGVRVGRRRV